MMRKHLLSSIQNLTDKMDAMAEAIKEPARRARGSFIPKSTQRVFLCWDMSDTELRDKVADDILSQDCGADCVVSYYDSKWSLPPEDEAITKELRSTRLFVFVVTPLFLEQNAAEDTNVFRIAKRLNQNKELEMLPIVANAGLFKRLTVNEGAIHGVAMDDAGYRKKLSEQLDSFIASDGLMQDMNDRAKGFPGMVFLSYRKMDIDCAHVFIKALHDVPGLDRIAVWYDNFLTGGRVFDAEIRASIDSADVFVLLVTPNLLLLNDEGKPNYVLAEELPYAVATQRKIVMVEAAETDRNALRALLPRGLSDDTMYITLDELSQCKRFFDQSIFTNELNDERAYLLGMAYMQAFLAERNYERAVAMFEIASKSASLFGAKAAVQEARIWEHTQTPIAFTQALCCWLDAIDIQKRVFGEESPDIAVSYNNLAALYDKDFDFDSALTYYELALTVTQRIYGADHIATAAILDNIGGVYNALHNSAEAIGYYTKALLLREREDKTSSSTAKSYNNFALAYMNCGDYAKAYALYQKALKLSQKARGREHHDTITTQKNIAVLYMHQGKFKKAFRIYGDIITVQSKIWGEKSLEVSETWLEAAGVFAAEGDFPCALECCLQVQETQEKILGMKHPVTIKTFSYIGWIYACLGHLKDAEIYNKLSLDSYAAYLSHGAVSDIDALEREGLLPCDDATLAILFVNSGTVLYACGQRFDALHSFERALKIQLNKFGPAHLEAAVSNENIAFLYDELNDYKNAVIGYTNAVHIRERKLGANHPTTLETKRKLHTVLSKMD